jgi:hypothetical protein
MKNQTTRLLLLLLALVFLGCCVLCAQSHKQVTVSIWPDLGSRGSSCGSGHDSLWDLIDEARDSKQECRACREVRNHRASQG